jgi:hypothetical protein
MTVRQGLKAIAHAPGLVHFLQHILERQLGTLSLAWDGFEPEPHEVSNIEQSASSRPRQLLELSGGR